MLFSSRILFTFSDMAAPIDDEGDAAFAAYDDEGGDSPHPSPLPEVAAEVEEGGGPPVSFALVGHDNAVRAEEVSVPLFGLSEESDSNASSAHTECQLSAREKRLFAAQRGGTPCMIFFPQ